MLISWKGCPSSIYVIRKEFIIELQSPLLQGCYHYWLYVPPPSHQMKKRVHICVVYKEGGKKAHGYFYYMVVQNRVFFDLILSYPIKGDLYLNIKYILNCITTSVPSGAAICQYRPCLMSNDFLGIFISTNLV